MSRLVCLPCVSSNFPLKAMTQPLSRVAMSADGLVVGVDTKDEEWKWVVFLPADCRPSRLSARHQARYVSWRVCTV